METKEYKGYIIQLQGSGFIPLATSAGMSAYFWVVKKDGSLRCRFIFSRSMTDSFENTEETSEVILSKAEAYIRDYLDNNDPVDLNDYLIEYKNYKFIYKGSKNIN